MEFTLKSVQRVNEAVMLSEQSNVKILEHPEEEIGQQLLTSDRLPQPAITDA